MRRALGWHALIGLVVISTLTLGDAAPARAAAARSLDPAIGPHAREEAQHASMPLQFTPARTPILPRRLPAGTGPLQVRPAGLNDGGPLQVQPAALWASETIPARPAAVVGSGGNLRHEVLGFAPYWSLPVSSSWNYSLLSTVAYFGLDFNPDGNFNSGTRGWAGWNSQELATMINLAHGAGDRVVVVVKTFDNPTINQIVTSPAATQTAITNTINAIASRNLDGVNVDFEGSTDPRFPNIQAGFTNFMTKLSAQVHQRWPSAQVSADTYSGAASWDGGIFNIGALAPVIDAFFIMAYDMGLSNLPGQASPNAPLNGWTYNDTTSVAQYMSKAPAQKIILGVPYYGYKWSTTSNQPYATRTGGPTAVTYRAVLDDLACAPNLTRSWDATAESPWAFWFSPIAGDPCGSNFNSWREMYWDDATSLMRKYDLVNTQNLLGTGIWALGYDGDSPDLWQALRLKFVATVPGAPLSVTARPANGKATVSWAPPATDGGTPITGYTVTASPGSSTLMTDANTTSTTVTDLVNGLTYSFTVTAANLLGKGPVSVASNTVTPTQFPGQFRPLPPARILDTRSAIGGTLRPDQAVDVPVVGQGGIPATGVGAVVLNVTATNPTAAGYLTVYPTGLPRPVASNLNFRPGQTVPNLVEVAVGAGGRVSIYNAAGSTDVILDVAGWVSSVDATSGTAGAYRGLPPARLLDTRSGTGAAAGAIGPGQSLDLQVSGRAGVPAAGASAAVINVTAVNPTADGFLTAFPTGTPLPLASTLNFQSGQVVANRAIVQLGSGGKITIYNSAGRSDVVVDVAGWFTDGSDAAGGGQFTGRSPIRLLDTRSGRPVGPGESLPVTVAGQNGVPSSGATAVVLNVTAVNPSAAGFLTVFPSGVAQPPLASDLNFVAGAVVPNLVIVGLGPDGRIAVYNPFGTTDVVIDLIGWFS